LDDHFTKAARANLISNFVELSHSIFLDFQIGAIHIGKRFPEKKTLETGGKLSGNFFSLFFAVKIDKNMLCHLSPHCCNLQ
jgi:hypothetical protein